MHSIAQHHIIIGGGLIGLLSAHYLREAGKKVTVVEKGSIGKESSWAGGGILSPLYPWRYPDAVTQLASWSQQAYPALIQRLSRDTHIDAQLNRCGLLILDDNEISAAMNWARQYDKTIEIINPLALKNIAPDINPNAVREQALWLPDIAQIRNPRMLKALVISLTQRGVTILENTPVSEIITDKNKLSGIVINGESIQAKSVTIACGAWSSQLLKHHPLSLTIEPVRGQMIVFKAAPRLLNTMLLSDSHYLIPRLDGRILAGSTVEYVGFNKDNTPDAKKQLFQFATTLYPKLEGFPVEHHWAGLRPGSATQIPLICQHPDIENLYINAGHFRNGVVTAPASARLLVDLILNNSPILDRKAYMP